MLQAIQRAYETCKGNNSAEVLPEAWAPLNALEGKHVTAFRNGQQTTGIGRGIDATGALLLEQQDGKMLSIHAGEVSLRRQ